MNSENSRLTKLWNPYRTDTLKTLRKWWSWNANIDLLIINYCLSLGIIIEWINLTKGYPTCHIFILIELLN